MLLVFKLRFLPEKPQEDLLIHVVGILPILHIGISQLINVIQINLQHVQFRDSFLEAVPKNLLQIC